MGYVRDRWTQPGLNGRRTRTERWGRGRRWQAVWTEAGTRKAQTFGSKDAALQHLALAETGQLASARGAPRVSMTFGEAWERWRSAQLHHKAATRATVTQTGGRMILPTLADRPIGELTRADLQDLVTRWADDGYASSRIRVAWSFVTAPLKLAVLDGLLTSSPAVGVRLPARTRQRVIPLTVDQVEHIAGHVPPWFRAMVIVGASSGLRSGELRGLTWDRVVDGTLVVDRQLVDVAAGRPVFGSPKSAASTRTVQLGTVAIAALEAHRERWPELGHGLVFYSRYRLPVARSTANDAWRSAVQGLDVRPRSGWHDLRHFHASLLIAAGLSVRAVADRLGHDDPAETLQTYSHLWPTDQGRAVKACDDLLGPVFGPLD